MSREVQSLGPFVGLFTETGYDTPEGYASGCLNVRVKDGRIRPRWGFRNVAARPSYASYACYGFEWLNGYDSSYVNHQEWVSIENISGAGIMPYSVNPSTGARTLITSSGSPVTLASGDWKAVTFYGVSYWINPASAISVYSHVVGTNTDWNNPSTLPVAAPTVPGQILRTIPPLQEQAMFVNGTDTVATSMGATLSGFGASSGGIVASGAGAGMAYFTVPNTTWGYRNDWIQWVITLSSSDRSWSNQLYANLTISAGGVTPGGNDSFHLDTANMYVVITNGSGTSSSNLPIIPSNLNAPFDQPYGTYLYGWIDMSGVSASILSDVQKITIRFSIHETGAAGYWLTSFALGGMRYHDSTGVAMQNAADPSLQYAFNYTEGSTVGTASALTPLAGNILDGQDIQPHADLPGLGSQLQIKIPCAGASTGFTTGATINLYRLNGTSWQRIWQTSNSVRTTVALVTFNDLYTDSYLTANTATLPVTTLTFSAPVLVGTGIINAFALQGWVCWLYPGGYQNVQHSRVGNPVQLSASTDDPLDLTRGATFSLSDSFTDEPVGGCQVGAALAILGHQGCYTQVGANPSSLTPPHKVAGSLGCAGRFAYTRFKSDNGDPGIAWVDPSGEGVWFVGLWQIYASDSGARPTELSASIRGFLRTFLLYPQQTEFGFTDFSGLRLAVDEATQSLWVVLGNRALVLRPPNPAANGARQWEPYQFATEGYADGRSGVYNAANWSLVSSPSPPATGEGGTMTYGGSDSFSATFTATWTGSGPAPAYVGIKFQTSPAASGMASTLLSGWTISDGYGGSPVVGTNSLYINTMVTVTVGVVAGVASYTTNTMSCTLNGSQYGWTINLDYYKPDLSGFGFGVIAPPSGIGWQYLAFSPNRKLWALRGSGEIDEIEWSSASTNYIGGANRDGGFTMPTGYWTSGRMRGANRRLTLVGVDQDDPTQSVTLTGFCTRNPSGYSVSTPANYRFARFPANQVGYEHRISITVPEAMNGVTGLDLTFTSVSQEFDR